MTDIKDLSEIQQIVQKWWSALQYERKCNSTNTVFKIVSRSSEETQQVIREIISQDIRIIIESCRDTRDVNEMQRACNAINGCFDNFVHAVDAVRIRFKEVIDFIDFGLEYCQSKLILKSSSKNSLLELLHSLSRILILVLKLQRSQNAGKVKNLKVKKFTEVYNLEDVERIRKTLVNLSFKIGQFLVMDEILIDTKNNLSMSGILIKEILISSEEKLIEVVIIISRLEGKMGTNKAPAWPSCEKISTFTCSTIVNKVLDTLPFQPDSIFLHLNRYYIDKKIFNMLTVNNEFHKRFVNTIPSTLTSEDFKLNILKFLTCSAIINTWPVNIIDIESTYTYLLFFVSLCENYSSETPIILNTSRTLLLLIKHESFKQFINNSDSTKVHSAASVLLSCVFMLLEHPVACVRHSAKEFLHFLVSVPCLQSIILESVFKLPADKRCYFISIGSLANEMGSRILIEKNKNLPKQLFTALRDPTIVSHVSLALECIILKDLFAEKNFSEWCETWIVPLLVSLMNVLPIVAADIDKLLEKAFKKCPNAILYITNKWAHPASEEELRYVITALKISQKQGFKFKQNFNESVKNGEVIKNEDLEDKIFNEELIEHCLHQRDDDIRISTFSLLIEAHKSTKPYSEKDFRLILYFLKYNLNNHQPATRQKILGLVRKMLVRFSESKATFHKFSKNNCDQAEKSQNTLLYDRFLNSLTEFCFSNIFVGCNFNRLNTVLNILLLCFENIKEMTLHSAHTNFYWSKLLVALDSSYEENKELAVILTEKLDMSALEANELKVAKALFEKAFSLCIHMEPPDVLTGSYLLQALMCLPISKKVLMKYLNEDNDIDVRYCCVKILQQKLKEQLSLAKLDLMTAATCGPMYGTLFAIRLVFKKVDFLNIECKDDETRKFNLSKWAKLLNDLVEISYEMAHTVGCVVNSSSPEGHLPMDFQTDFEHLLSSTFAEGCSIIDSLSNKPMSLFAAICDNFFEKFKKIQFLIESSNYESYDAYETLRSLKSLFKENQLLIGKAKVLEEKIGEKFLSQLEEAKCELEKYIDKLEKVTVATDWPATAQVLLLCAWRSIKEASLYLGDLVTKLPIETQINLGLLDKTKIIRIGEELKTLLCEIKHRGAFEHAYIGFSLLVNSLWKCADNWLRELPRKWLQEIIDLLESPLKDQKMKLCSTRRSAGLPFLVQAIICSEIISVKSSTPSSLHNTMRSLLDITEYGVEGNPESKIHALNVLRALFKHAQLGEHVASYVSRALMIAIRGSRAATWPERNSSSLLFSSLIIRIFGVARSKDEISKKNRMTSRTFFQRYSELYNFLLSEMELVYSKENYVDGLYPKPSLYLVLLILGRLYPPPTEDPVNIDLSEFLPYINMSRKNPTMKIRELGARALVPLISLDRLVDELDSRFGILASTEGISPNERHGILLQIKALLNESVGVLDNLTKANPREKEVSWIENTKWMLLSRLQDVKKLSFVTLSTYVKVLHIFFKNCQYLREKITELIMSTSLVSELMELKSCEQKILPGVFLFLENFYYVQTDVLGFSCINDSRKDEEFNELFMFMMKCRISEVQSIPFRMLYYAVRGTESNVDDDDDFNGIATPVEDLLIMKAKENISPLRSKILSNPEIIKFLVDQLNEDNSTYISSKIIHRIWLSTVSALVMNNVILVNESPSNKGTLRVDFAKSLIKSGDKDFSTNSLICYGIYLMNKISTSEKEDRIKLYHILNEFSSKDADVKERLAVAKILIRSSENLIEKIQIQDPYVMNIWMIPFKLLLDEDPGVRLVIGEIVQKLQGHLLKSSPKKFLINTLNWPNLPLISLKAQECLLDLYLNIVGTENLTHLVAQMLIISLSAIADFDDLDNYSKDEFGVFEKGNPNPFCEDFALSDLMSRKLKELGNLETLMWDGLDSSVAKFVADCLHLTDCVPGTLMEVVETVTTVIEDAEKLSKEFSLARLQVRSLRTALGLRGIV